MKKVSKFINKKTILFLILMGVVLWNLPSRYVYNVHYKVYQCVALYFPNFAQNVIGKPYPKLVRRFLDKKILEI